MAARKPAYDEATQYEVKLMRAVTFRGARLLPLHRHEMTGATLIALVAAEGDDIVDAAQPR